MNNVFKFESLDGVPYIFDNNNGIIYEDLTSSNSDNTRIKEYNEMYLQNLRKSLAVFENLNLHDITVDEIANYYEESGFTELIFKMTDACNMRCKYCIYSEHYPDTLTYGNDYISTEIVMKAIDEYMGYIIKLKKNIPDKVPFIAFYGGEPLMAFEVIKEAINYVEEKYSDLNTQYTITTNGILLKNKEICNYLKSKNVIICLSFDGYKENHDRNRILSSNQPSYDQLISIITDNFQEYENIYSLCCIDTRTDLVKLYDFYKQNDRMSGGIIPHVLRFSFIFNQGSDYYNQFTKEEKEKFNYQLNLLIIRDFSMSICRGEKVFLKGKNGCGKSTLFRLLLRLYPVKSGKIYLNGCAINDITRDSILKNIKYVAQKSFLFNDSIQNNILYGLEDYDKQKYDELIEAFSLKQLIDRIDKESNGLIGENGCNLSGGEIQKLVLCRTFIQNPKCIILDEATSNLDSKSRKIVKEYIQNSYATILIVDHTEEFRDVCDYEITI